MTDEELDSLVREALREEPRRADTPCPSLDELIKFIQKKLLPDDRKRVDMHVVNCRRCTANVARLYRRLEQQEPKRPWWAVFLDFCRASWFKFTPSFKVTIGLAAAAATMLILALIWKLRGAPRKDMVVKKDGNEPKPAPQIVREPDKGNAPPESPQQPQPSPDRKDKSAPQPPSQPKPRSPQRRPSDGLLVKATKAEAKFLAMREQILRSGGETGEPSLTAAKPNRTVILSPTPELIAEVSGIAGPFTFHVEEVVKMDGDMVEFNTIITETRDKPSLTLTKPLTRGKIYLWHMSVGEGEQRKTSGDAVFMVAEQGTVDAEKKYKEKHAHSPLQLAEFYKAHGLYLDAQTVLDEWLAKHSDDSKAQRMKSEIERLLSPADRRSPKDES